MTHEEKAIGPTADEAKIRNVLKSFAEAWNRHDAVAFSMAFAEDADFTNVIGMSAHGRTEIAHFHVPIFATIFRASVLKVSGVKVRFIKADVAAVDSWWEMTGARDRNDAEIPMRKGLANLIVTEQGDQWVISVMHNMDLPV